MQHLGQTRGALASPEATAAPRPSNALWDRVIETLRGGLSPEQASGILARMAEPVCISHEAIYTARGSGFQAEPSALRSDPSRSMNVWYRATGKAT